MTRVKPCLLCGTAQKDIFCPKCREQYTATNSYLRLQLPQERFLLGTGLMCWSEAMLRLGLPHQSLQDDLVAEALAPFVVTVRCLASGEEQRYLLYRHLERVLQGDDIHAQLLERVLAKLKELA